MWIIMLSEPTLHALMKQITWNSLPEAVAITAAFCLHSRCCVSPSAALVAR